jgi:hypothetical protein
MLRYGSLFRQQLESMIADHVVAVRTAHHIAASRLEIRGDRILLTQEFREGNHYNKTAVAIGITGRAVTARFAGESEVRLAAQPGKGRFTVLIASASRSIPRKT